MLLGICGCAGNPSAEYTRGIGEYPGKADTSIRKDGDRWTATVRFENSTYIPAYYSDNYIALMPGEEKDITISFKDEDTRGERPDVEIRVFNLK